MSSKSTISILETTKSNIEQAQPAIPNSQPLCKGSSTRNSRGGFVRATLLALGDSTVRYRWRTAGVEVSFARAAVATLMDDVRQSRSRPKFMLNLCGDFELRERDGGFASGCRRR